MSDEKIRITFLVSPDAVGPLLIAAINLRAEIDACGLHQYLPFNKNIPTQTQVSSALRQTILQLPSKQKSYHPNGVQKAKSNGPALRACVVKLKEAGDKGLPWDELKELYRKSGASMQGVNSAFKQIARRDSKTGRLHLKPDAKIHGEAVS